MIRKVLIGGLCIWWLIAVGLATAILLDRQPMPGPLQEGQERPYY